MTWLVSPATTVNSIFSSARFCIFEKEKLETKKQFFVLSACANSLLDRGHYHSRIEF